MNFKPATHILYRTDFKDDSMWDWILEAHGIEQDAKGNQYAPASSSACLASSR